MLMGVTLQTIRRVAQDVRSKAMAHSACKGILRPGMRRAPSHSGAQVLYPRAFRRVGSDWWTGPLPSRTLARAQKPGREMREKAGWWRRALHFKRGEEGGALCRGPYVASRWSGFFSLLRFSLAAPLVGSGSGGPGKGMGGAVLQLHFAERC